MNRPKNTPLPNPPTTTMDPSTQIMRFGRDTPYLGAPALIAIAVAVAAFIAWLALTTREPDAMDLLRWIAAGLIGLVGIGFAGSWHEVVVDAKAKQVTNRHGFLKFPVNWLGETLKFSDITAVVVVRKTTKESKPASFSGSGGTRTVYEKSYTLNLFRADRTIVLPNKTQMVVPQPELSLPRLGRADPLVLEAMARQLSRLGGWPAKRRGYALGAPISSADAPSRPSINSAPFDTETPIEN